MSRLSILLFASLLSIGFVTTVQAQERLTLRETWKRAKQELHLYRGRILERVTDRIQLGRSNFDRTQSVAQNLQRLVRERNIPHYYREINGRQVLHVVAELAQGAQTKKTLRQIYRQIGHETVEVNYKYPSAKNRYGHVAVRAGLGPVYDLTGSQGIDRLPRLVEWALRIFKGKRHVSLARRRNLRRFMEGRKGDHSTSVYFGLLFAADKTQQKSIEKVFRKRRKTMTEFHVNGGDGSKGVYSCAQFLTEDVPFLNDRGVARTISARSMGNSAAHSPALEAVVVYKMPAVQLDALPQL